MKDAGYLSRYCWGKCAGQGHHNPLFPLLGTCISLGNQTHSGQGPHGAGMLTGTGPHRHPHPPRGFSAESYKEYLPGVVVDDHCTAAGAEEGANQWCSV